MPQEGCCSSILQRPLTRNTILASDGLKRKIAVEVKILKFKQKIIFTKFYLQAEGDPQEYTQSLFFCPNDRLNISTKESDMKYQFVKLSQESHQFSFVVKGKLYWKLMSLNIILSFHLAKGDVHISLSGNASFGAMSHEIVIGGSLNTHSWISHNNRRLVTAATNEILSEKEFRSFWIKWENGNIEVCLIVFIIIIMIFNIACF